MSERTTVNTRTGETLGARITRLRGDRKQTEFAKALGVGLSTLRRYESDERVPDADFLRGLAGEIPDLNLSWLLTGEGEPRQDVMPFSDFAGRAEQGVREPDLFGYRDPVVRDQSHSDACMRSVREAFSSEGLDVGLGLLLLMRDLCYWHDVPRETLDQVARAIREEFERRGGR